MTIASPASVRRSLGRLLLTSTLAAVGLAARSASAESYDSKGPYAVVVEDLKTSPAAKIAYPQGDGPFPVLILGHGFSASPDNQIGWGEHFASHGFIAMAPALCSGLLCAPDAYAAPDTVKAALDYLVSADAPGAIAGKVDITRFGFEGHSAGGQAMTMAAAALKPTALVLFDPVPGDQSPGNLEPGKSALAKVCSPTLTMFAENHDGFMSCNKTGAWKGFGFDSTGPRLGAVVAGSTHCDGENKPRFECGLACGGGAKPERQARYAHYATAWFLWWLKGDQAALAEAQLGKMQGDPLLHDAAALDGPLCPGAPGTGGAGGAPQGTGGAAGDPTGAGGEQVGGQPGSAGAAGEGGASPGAGAQGGGAGQGNTAGGASGKGGAVASGGKAQAGTSSSSGDGTPSGPRPAAGGEGGSAGAAPSSTGASSDGQASGEGGDAEESGGCSLPSRGRPGLVAAIALVAAAALRRRRR